MSATFQDKECQNCDDIVTICRDSVDAGDCCDGTLCQECGDFYCSDCLFCIDAVNLSCCKCGDYFDQLISRDERREKNDNDDYDSKFTIDGEEDED